MPQRTRPAWLEVDLGAIEHNFAETRRRAGPHRRVIAAVKGNAYGLGVVEVSRRLERLGAFALWTGQIDEAIALRAAGIAAKIIMFGGYLPAQVEALVDHDLIPTIYDSSGLTAVAEAARRRGRVIRVYVKVDSGLGRLGVPVGDAAELITAAVASAGVHVEGVYTHLPFGNDHGKAWARERYEHFVDLLDELAQVEGLGENPGLAAGEAGLIERDRGEAGDEHDAQFRQQGTDAARQLDAVDARHDDVGEQEVEIGDTGEREGGIAVAHRIHLVAGALERPCEKRAHVVVVLGEEYSRHCASVPKFDLTSSTLYAAGKVNAR